MSTSAFIKGWTFAYDADGSGGNTTYNPLLEVTEVSGLAETVELVEVTHFASTAKEYVAGLADGSEITITCNLLPGDSDQQEMINGSSSGKGTTNSYKFTCTDGTSTDIYTFNAVNLGYEIAPALDSQNQITFTLKVTGSIAHS